MGLIVDSSVIIAVERVGQTAYQLLENLRREAGDQEIGVSTITILELAHGVTRANTQQRRSARKQFLDELLVGIPVHAVDTAVALRAGEIDGSLHAQGVRVALADLLIGATALELGYSLLTSNVRHFKMIPGLEVKQA